MGNLALCGPTDTITRKLKDFYYQYPHYNNEENLLNKKKKDIEGMEAKLYEHYKNFMKNKEELQKTNKQLFDKFFVDSPKETKLEIKHLKNDDESKFLFFFNLRIYTSITITDSYVVFPKFCTKYFPKFRADESTLEKIVINDSIVVFDDNQDNYNKIKHLNYLDISFNAIENIPLLFRKLDYLTVLLLKRNCLTNLDPGFQDLKLIELDLSENKIKKIPDVCFNLRKLEKLNLNSNFIESLESTKENFVLEYLFLANNKIPSIPPDIINFKKLKHLALDSNKVLELNVNIFVDSGMKVKVTLSNNLIKQREGLYPGFKSDILTYPATKSTDDNKTEGNTADISKGEKLTDETKYDEDQPNANVEKNIEQGKITANDKITPKAKNLNSNTNTNNIANTSVQSPDEKSKVKTIVLLKNIDKKAQTPTNNLQNIKKPNNTKTNSISNPNTLNPNENKETKKDEMNGTFMENEEEEDEFRSMKLLKKQFDENKKRYIQEINYKNRKLYFH